MIPRNISREESAPEFLDQVSLKIVEIVLVGLNGSGAGVSLGLKVLH